MDAAIAQGVMAVTELRLIAPSSLGELAEVIGRDARNHCRNIVKGTDSVFKFYTVRQQLYDVMRADLGEPTDGATAAPG